VTAIRRSGICLSLAIMALTACSSSATSPSAATTPSAIPAASPSVGSPSATATVLTRYEPWTDQGALASSLISQRERGHAECWMASYDAKRPDAFRCIWGNHIGDRCFLDPATATAPFTLACLREMTSRVTLITVQKLPRPNPPVTGEPDYWEFLLEDGTTCIQPPYNGSPLGTVASCDDGRIAVDINTDSPMWVATIRDRKEPGKPVARQTQNIVQASS